MDRALNPDDLADALGQHGLGRLPTVQELTELIANVEVQAFLQPDELDPQLLRTAWYVHGSPQRSTPASCTRRPDSAERSKSQLTSSTSP